MAKAHEQAINTLSMVFDRIPISFTYEGTQYAGAFNMVHGAGTNVWYLMIDRYYRGQLSYNESQDQWSYHGNAFEEMGSYFGDYVVAWIQ